MAAVGEKKRKSYTLIYKLEAVKYAEETSKEAAAKKYQVATKQIREWTKNKDKLVESCSSTGMVSKKKKRLEGCGRKPLSMPMEIALVDWIDGMREKHLRVSRKMVAAKAIELFSEVQEGETSFTASNGWLCRFFERHGITVRRRTTMGQKLPDALAPKLMQFILYVRSMRIRYSYSEKDIIAMDETAVWFDMPSETTLAKVGSKSVPLKTTGHEKQRITVVLAARASGNKLKPMMVFKGKRRDPAVENIAGIEYVMSNNGWMNQELTEYWLKNVVGQMSFSRRLVVWDSYRCHISEATKEVLRQLRIDLAVIPGGCTGVIQAPDVSWNAPFKANIRAYYDQWMATGEKTYTVKGNVRAPTRALLATWVCDAWEALPEQLIIKSFKTCALTNDLETEESVKEIHCLKEAGIIHSSVGEVLEKCKILKEKDGNLEGLVLSQEEDSEETGQNELLVDDE